MASTAAIVQEVLTEFGRTDQVTAARVEQKVNDIVVDLLSQNEGRFKALEKTQTISILKDVTEYRLNVDFNTAKETFYEVDSDGEYKNDCVLTQKSEINRRKKESEEVNSRICYIKHYESHPSGRGVYLVLAEKPTEDTTYEFDYYRQPRAEDIDIIKKPSTIKMGVRSGFPDLNPKADYELAIYERRKSGFREKFIKYTPKMSVKPPRKAARFNRFMERIGQGG